MASFPWQIYSSCQAVNWTSLLHTLSCAVALWASSLLELEMSSNDTVPCDKASSSSEWPSSSSSAAASSSSPYTRTTLGDTEREHPKLLEPLPSEGAWGPAGEPVPDSLLEPDSDDPKLLEPDTLPDPELEPEEDELDLEPREQWPGDGDLDGLCRTREWDTCGVGEWDAHRVGD